MHSRVSVLIVVGIECGRFIGFGSQTLKIFLILFLVILATFLFSVYNKHF